MNIIHDIRKIREILASRDTLKFSKNWMSTDMITANLCQTKIHMKLNLTLNQSGLVWTDQIDFASIYKILLQSKVLC